MNKTWEKRRKRAFEIIEVGNDIDIISRSYDFLNALCIIINLIVSILYTFDEVRSVYGPFLVVIEEITVIGFAIDYILRLWTAKHLHPSYSEKKALKKYAFSFMGIVDLLSFLPYYLPIFFPPCFICILTRTYTVSYIIYLFPGQFKSFNPTLI